MQGCADPHHAAHELMLGSFRHYTFAINQRDRSPGASMPEIESDPVPKLARLKHPLKSVVIFPVWLAFDVVQHALSIAECPAALLAEVAAPDRAGEKLLQEAVAKFGHSARGYHRVLRLARTLADLEARTGSSRCI